MSIGRPRRDAKTVWVGTGDHACQTWTMAFKPLPRPGGPPAVRVGTPLSRVLRHLGVPAVKTLTDLERSWVEAVGPALAQKSQPVTVRDGKVVVRVDDPVWASQLRWMESQVVEHLAASPGFEQVTGLIVRVGPNERSGA